MQEIVTGTAPGRTDDRIILVGSGHLAQRIRALAAAEGRQIIAIARTVDSAGGTGASSFDQLVRTVHEADVDHVSVAYLVDDRDEVNLELLIALLAAAPALPVVVSLFNENIAPHLQSANPNVRVVNPARIAAPTFVAALDRPLERTPRYRTAPGKREVPTRSTDPLMVKLCVSFAAILLAAVAYFHGAQQLSWIDSAYFVVVTVATVGYGDVNLLNASTFTKLVDIALILASTVFIWMIFSLTVDGIIKRRVQYALGRRVYATRDHVIVCGLGRLGHFIVDGLLDRGERVIIVERDESDPLIEQFRARGVDVYVGDARSARVLQAVGTAHAKAVYAVVNNDFANLEIGLNARTIADNVRLVLRIFDSAMSAHIREQLDIELTYSLSAIADDPVYRAIRSVAATAS